MLPYYCVKNNAVEDFLQKRYSKYVLRKQSIIYCMFWSAVGNTLKNGVNQMQKLLDKTILMSPSKGIASRKLLTCKIPYLFSYQREAKSNSTAGKDGFWHSKVFKLLPCKSIFFCSFCVAKILYSRVTGWWLLRDPFFMSYNVMHDLCHGL